MLEDYLYTKYKDKWYKEYIYIDYIEVNRYYRNKGLYKKTVLELSKRLDKNKDIITSEMTDIGRLCNTHKYFCMILKENGYTGNIQTEYEFKDEVDKKIRNKLLKRKT